MPHPDSAVVTSAFRYTGKHEARRRWRPREDLDAQPGWGGPLRGHGGGGPFALSDPDELRRSI